MPFIRKLAANATADPADVVTAKIALRNLGYYDAPDWGISEYPDRALFGAIRVFQSKQGLRTDGVIKPGGETEAALNAIARDIQAQGRNGDTLLAHISPQEAALLDHVTDGASINPATGLLEFWFGFGGDDNTSDYESAVSKAADSNISDSDFWSGYEQATSAYDKANSDGALGSSGGAVSTVGDDQVQRGGSGPSDASMLQTKGVAPSTNIVNGRIKVPSKRVLLEAKRKEDKRETLGQDPFALNKDAPVPVNKGNPTLPGNYNPDETIADVERQNKAIMERSRQLVAERNGASAPVSADNELNKTAQQQAGQRGVLQRKNYKESLHISNLKGMYNDGLIYSGKSLDWKKSPDTTYVLGYGQIPSRTSFIVKGPVRVKPTSPTFGYESASIKVDWFGLDETGKVTPEVRNPDTKLDTYNVGGGFNKGPGHLDFAPPYADVNPNGYMMTITTAPQKDVHQNPVGIDMNVYTLEDDEPAKMVK